MRELHFSADETVAKLLNLPTEFNLSLLDSCGVSTTDTNFLLAGIKPTEKLRLSARNPQETLDLFNRKLSRNFFGVFTISYDFGLKLENLPFPLNSNTFFEEPDISLSLYENVIIHDYRRQKTFLDGNQKNFDEIQEILQNSPSNFDNSSNASSIVTSNFKKSAYLQAIEEIKEFIRRGDTYQTNLTQQFTALLNSNLSPEKIFRRLRQNNPTAFSAFLNRGEDFVVSASPERFLTVENLSSSNRRILTSPIKGTRPRGRTAEEDVYLQKELANSGKDRAENVMIVDLLRNDLGRICHAGTVEVEKLCEIEENPTVFHLVSTVSGRLLETVSLSDIIKAVFPCGSITGCPKIRTMQIISEIEKHNRGLSMGAIGYSLLSPQKTLSAFEMNVAIRTMIIRQQKATFNVGGGIVIDSDPEGEYQESMTKAAALLRSLNAIFTG